MTHAHDFQDQECATSLISCTLSGDPNSSYSGSSGSSNTYYCVGTAYVIPVEPEPKSGRLLLFQLVEGMIILFVLRLFFSQLFPIFPCRTHYYCHKTIFRVAQKTTRANNGKVSFVSCFSLEHQVLFPSCQPAIEKRKKNNVYLVILFDLLYCFRKACSSG